MKTPDPFVRFWQKVALDDNGCWLWQGHLSDKGYGRFHLTIGGKHKKVSAHKFIWQSFNGSVPDGLELDHLCRVKRCVNLAHIEAVPHGINMLRSPISINAINAGKITCMHGHEFNEANTYVKPDGSRQCLICQRRRSRDYYHRKREAL